jgi:hypothetical protein
MTSDPPTAPPDLERWRVRLLVDLDLEAVQRSLRPLIACGLMPTSIKVERKDVWLKVEFELDSAPKSLLQKVCARLAAIPAVHSVEPASLR